MNQLSIILKAVYADIASMCGDMSWQKWSCIILFVLIIGGIFLYTEIKLRAIENKTKKYDLELAKNIKNYRVAS